MPTAAAQDESHSAGKQKTLILAVIALLGLAAINGYVILKLLPDQNNSLPVLIRIAPDLGILMILLLLLSLAWVLACAVLFAGLQKARIGWVSVRQSV